MQAAGLGSGGLRCKNLSFSATNAIILPLTPNLMPDYQPRFTRKPFNKGPNDRFSSGPKTMHKVDCAKCGNVTEVPFRPNGKKPVYCQNCFVKDDAPRSSYGPKREYAPRPSFNREAPAAPREDRSMADVKSELQAVNQKLSKLISLMEYSQAAPAPEPVAKKAAKKAAKKK